MANKRPIVGPSQLAEHVDADILINGQGALFVEQGSALATPASGSLVIYAKNDGKIYAKNDAGTEFDLTATGGGSSTTLNEFLLMGA